LFFSVGKPPLRSCISKELIGRKHEVLELIGKPSIHAFAFLRACFKLYEVRTIIKNGRLYNTYGHIIICDQNIFRDRINYFYSKIKGPALEPGVGRQWLLGLSHGKGCEALRHLGLQGGNGRGPASDRPPPAGRPRAAPACACSSSRPSSSVSVYGYSVYGNGIGMAHDKPHVHTD
jgi:hypothetical protein